MTSSPTSTMNSPVASSLGLPNIAFCGKAGAGKTTAAVLLESTLDYQVFHFAGRLKEIARLMWGEHADHNREYLQQLGVSARKIDPDVWVNLLCRDMRDPIGYGLPVVVDDLRFPNEYDALKALGFVVVRVRAPRMTRVARLTANGKWQNEEQLYHESETALDDHTFDYIIDNDFDRVMLEHSIFQVIHKERKRR